MKLALVIAFGIIATASAQDSDASELLKENTFNSVARVQGTLSQLKAEQKQTQQVDAQSEADEFLKENTFNSVARVQGTLSALKAQQNANQVAEEQVEHVNENTQNAVNRVLNTLETVKAQNAVMNRTSRNPRFNGTKKSTHCWWCTNNTAASVEQVEEKAQSLNDIKTTEKTAENNNFAIFKKPDVKDVDAHGVVKNQLVADKTDEKETAVTSAEQSEDAEEKEEDAPQESKFKKTVKKVKGWVKKTAKKAWNGLLNLWGKVKTLFSNIVSHVKTGVKKVKQYFGAD